MPPSSPTARCPSRFSSPPRAALRAISILAGNQRTNAPPLTSLSLVKLPFSSFVHSPRRVPRGDLLISHLVSSRMFSSVSKPGISARAWLLLVTVNFEAACMRHSSLGYSGRSSFSFFFSLSIACFHHSSREYLFLSIFEVSYECASRREQFLLFVYLFILHG